VAVGRDDVGGEGSPGLAKSTPLVHGRTRGGRVPTMHPGRVPGWDYAPGLAEVDGCGWPPADGPGQPLGAAGEMTRARACTTPAPFCCPLTRTHWPTASLPVLAVSSLVMPAVEGTFTVTNALPAVTGCMTKEAPLTLVIFPRRFTAFPGPFPPGATPGGGVQLPFMLNWTWTMLAVTSPAGWRWPATTTQAPDRMLAWVAPLVCSTFVVELYSIETLPLCSLTMSVPLPICVI